MMNVMSERTLKKEEAEKVGRGWGQGDAIYNKKGDWRRRGRGGDKFRDTKFR